MKRIIALLIITCFFLSACACSQTEIKKPKKPTSSSQQSSEEITSSDESSDITDKTDDKNNSVSKESLSLDTQTPAPTEIRTEKLPPENSYLLLNKQSSGAEAEAEILRKTIINSKDEIKKDGTVYYISVDGTNQNDGKSPETAWNTSAYTMNRMDLKVGDTVLFKRGDIFRGVSFRVVSGVNYGAYGTGNKPTFYGSPMDYASEEVWYPSDRKYIWKLDYTENQAGIIVFNHGESVGNKLLSVGKLSKNGDYYHNTSAGILYLYCDKGYPDIVYDSIEIGRASTIFSGPNVKNVHIDNMKILYSGSHSIQFSGTSEGITVTNCEIGWGGGAIMSTNGARYGNGVEFYGSAKNCTIRNCWVYQQYDAGITFQADEIAKYENIDFSKNLIEYCIYNIEFFISLNQNSTASKIYTVEDFDECLYKNIHFMGNVLRLAGYGWGVQRQYANGASNICGWDGNASANHGVKKNTTDFVIENNIFDCSANNLIYWSWKATDTQPGLIIRNNTFYQKKLDKLYHSSYQLSPTQCIMFGAGATSKNSKTAVNQKEFETAVSTFDKNPKKVKWLS